MNLKVTLQDFLNNLKASVAKEVKSEENDKKQDLAAELEEIEQAYKNSPYRTFNGIKVANSQELKDDAMTDEEIAKTATESVKAERGETEKKLKNAAASKIEALDANKSAVKENAEKSAAKITETVEKAKESAENQALKRGIGRSSIIAEELVGLDDASLKAIGEVYGAANEEIAKIDSSIASLNAELTDALDALDGETAVKINEKIKALKSERDKKNQEITKYNNSLRASNAEKLNALGVDAKEENSEEYVKQNGEKLKKLYAYYYSLGENAVNGLKDDKDFIVKYVGNSGYSYLNDLLGK